MSKVMRSIDAKSFIIGVLLTIVIGSAMGQQSGFVVPQLGNNRSTSTRKITNSIPRGYEVVGVDNGTIYYWKR
jgi:hypothetical protein